MRSDCLLTLLLLASAWGACAQTSASVAIIDVQAAMLNSQEGQKGVAALRQEFEPRRAQLQRRQEELQALQDRLDHANAAMSDEAKERLASEIQSKSRAIKHEMEDLEADATEAQNKLAKQLGPKMYEIVAKFAKEHGYKVVLDASNPQAPIYWADSSSLITTDTVKQYDSAHPVK